MKERAGSLPAAPVPSEQQRLGTDTGAKAHHRNPSYTDKHRATARKSAAVSARGDPSAVALKRNR